MHPAKSRRANTILMRRAPFQTMLLFLALVPLGCATGGRASRDAVTEAREFHLTSISYNNAICYKFEISPSQLLRNPPWEAGSQSISLQPDKAVKLALDWYRRIYPEVRSPSLSWLRLEPISKTKPRRWFYHASIAISAEEKSRLPQNALKDVVVLLNGEVVPPTIDPHPGFRAQ
jgi:hypothetical protein